MSEIDPHIQYARRYHSITPFPRIIAHSRTASAPIRLPSALPPYSAGPTKASHRPDLRVITSFPPPPARSIRPRRTVQPLATGAELRQPVPLRHAVAQQPIRTAPLPIRLSHAALAHTVRRKPTPDLHVQVDFNSDQTLVRPPIRPDAPIRASLEKRRNREAVIISTAVYTSCHPNNSNWTDTSGHNDEFIRDISPLQLIPSSNRPSGRGHKRTLSDKFKSLFSPSLPLRPSLSLGVPSSAPSRIPENQFERIEVYDDNADIPTYSAMYAQPDDPFHLCLPHYLPGRPYRSPGTASFVVNREEEIGDGLRGWGGRDEDASRRNTFGVVISDEGEEVGYGQLDIGDRAPFGGSAGVSPDLGHEADDEMSAVDDGVGDIIDVYLGGMFRSK